VGVPESRRRVSRRNRKQSIEEIAAEVSREVYSRLGLSLVGITEEEVRDIIEDIVRGIFESRSTRPTMRSLVKRIMSAEKMVKKMVAYKIYSEREELTLEQVEFMVYYAPELAGKAAPALYRIAVASGAEHLLPALRSLWSRYGKPTPYICPRCGFNSLLPDLVCTVCGSSVSESEYKDYIGFREALARFADNSPEPLAREVLQAGFVVYDGMEIRPPSMGDRRSMELYLTRDEKLMLRARLRNRGINL